MVRVEHLYFLKMWWLVAILFSTDCYSQIRKVLLDNRKEVYCLDSSLYSYSQTDSASTSSITDTRQYSDYFTRLEKFNYQFGYTTDWKWLAFDLENQQTSGQYYYLLIHNSMIEELSYFLKDVKTGKTVKYVETGFKYPFESRQVAHRHFIFKFFVPAKTQYRIYLRAHLNAGNLLMPMNVFSMEGYAKYISTNNSIVMAINLLWILACIFALLFYFSFRSITYLYYFGYIFFLMLFWSAYEGITFEYLWPHSAYLASNSRNFYIPAAISFTAFVLSVLSSSGRRLKKMWKFYKYIVFAYVPLFVLLLFPGSKFSFLNNIVFLNDIGLLVLIGIVIYAIYIKIKEGSKTAFWLLLSISPMMLYTIFQLLVFRGVLPVSRNNLFIQHGFGICAIVEICFLYWMITRMLRRIQEKQSLISQRLKMIQFRMSKQDAAKKENAVKYEKSKYSEEEIHLLHSRLKELMITQEPYLDSELHLNSLAEMLDCKPHMLSQCINQMEATNFNDYINTLRVEKAKALLLKTDENKLSIEGIGWEVGFANKSAFYTSFKKASGITPKQFREAAQAI